MQKLHGVLNVPQYVWISYLNLPEYVWIYDIKQGSEYVS